MTAHRHFHYHASAHALSGQFTRPFQRVIEVQAPSTLPTIGGVVHSRVDSFRLHDFVSFKAGYTHVIGSKKEERDDNNKLTTAYTTQVTSTVEDLNILDVVTADRVVARLTSTYDPEDKDVRDEARIILIGSKFENLRIAGCPVDVKLHHKLFLELDTFSAVRNLDDNNTFWDLMKKTLEAVQPGAKFKKKEPEAYRSLLCSIVKEVKFEDLDEGEEVCAGVKRYGHHRFHVQEFGNIYLGEVLFEHSRKTLTMLRVELGSPNGGGLVVAEASSNGQTWPPTG